MEHDTIERAAAYLDTLPPAVSGQQGHVALLKAASSLVNGFEIPEEQAVELLIEHYNPRCVPPWSEREIWHKVESAKSDRRGWLRNWRPNGHRPATAPRITVTLPKPTKAKDTKDTSIFLVEGGPERWLERPALRKCWTWNGKTCETRFLWNGFYWETEKPFSSNSPYSREVVFDWSAGDGAPRHLVNRLDWKRKPGETKQKRIRPYCWDSSAGLFRQGEGGIPRVPFMACELKEAGRVFLVEGEKSALALQRKLETMGLTPDVAATTTGSCSSWKPEFVEWFIGKRVEVIPDADEAGRKYANRVCGDLRSADVDAMIYPAFQDGFSAGFDVADWLEIEE